MAHFERDATSIYYEDAGDGYPLLLLAPGGLNSTIEAWQRAAINPLDRYAGDFRLVAMDQRNAGRSVGPLDVDDPWGSYVSDQIGLADHLGLDTFHAMGCCIGCSYALKMIELAPERVASAVLEQPIGLVDDNAPGGWTDGGSGRPHSARAVTTSTRTPRRPSGCGCGTANSWSACPASS